MVAFGIFVCTLVMLDHRDSRQGMDMPRREGLRECKGSLREDIERRHRENLEQRARHHKEIQALYAALRSGDIQTPNSCREDDTGERGG
jgi:hypothetical protein